MVFSIHSVSFLIRGEVCGCCASLFFSLGFWKEIKIERKVKYTKNNTNKN
jgi:hypothetical protein